MNSNARPDKIMIVYSDFLADLIDDPGGIRDRANEEIEFNGITFKYVLTWDNMPVYRQIKNEKN